jgi:hypothetical protein
MTKKQQDKDFIAFLLKSFTYDPDAGQLTWRTGPRSGRPAGSASSANPYIRIGIGEKLYYAHTLIVEYCTRDRVPEGFEIDHRNGDGHDNRLENLRLTTHADNMRNARMYHNNKSGVTGVYWDKATNCWRSSIGTTSIGRYGDFESAVRARRDAEWKLGYSPSHGRRTA